MNDIKVGDEVRVIDYSPWRKTPEGGYRATVVKVGRKYATVAYTRLSTSPYGRSSMQVDVTVQFDIATGCEKDSQTNYGRRMETPEQAEKNARQSAAIAALTARKIRLDSGHGLTLEQIEALAEVVKTWED